MFTGFPNQGYCTILGVLRIMRARLWNVNPLILYIQNTYTTGMCFFSISWLQFTQIMMSMHRVFLWISVGAKRSCKVQFGLLVPLLCEPCAGKSRFWRLGVDHGRLWGWEKNDMLIHFHAKMTSKRVATVNWQHGALDHSRLFCLLRFLSDLWCFFLAEKGVKLAVNPDLIFFFKTP